MYVKVLFFYVGEFKVEFDLYVEYLVLMCFYIICEINFVNGVIIFDFVVN